MNMKIKKINERHGESINFCDITTKCGNFVIADSGVVIHNSHITCLLLTALLKLVPNLIESGKVYMSIMPLYGTTIKKQFIPIYNDEELAKIKKAHPSASIQRYKGLGEMDPPQLKVVLLDKATRHIQQITLPESSQDVFDLMIKPELKRKIV